MKDNAIKASISMICITLIVMTALILGVDGVVLAAGLMALAGLGGYELKSLTLKRAEAKAANSGG